MDIKKLFKGIAVVIDDDIHKSNSSIYNILNQLKAESIPYVEYDSLPDEKIVDNLQNVSFVLLDWKLDSTLTDSEIISGVQLPAEGKKSNIEENINFLKVIQKVCFCPIFIFTDENVDNILLKLKQNKLYKSNACSNILVRSKSDFQGKDSLFKNLEKWIKETTPIYLLKEWNSSYQIAKSKLFIDFQTRSPDWTKILWKTYKDDKVNPSIELGNFISKSITTQMMPLELESSVFDASCDSVNRQELTSCLERQCYVQNEYLDGVTPETGDVFELNGDFYVNIRPSCDLVARKGTTIDEIELYLLKTEKIKKLKSIQNYFDIEYGHFENNDTYYLVYPICNGYLLKILFKELYQKKWGEVKSLRCGRLLSPYIVKLQMKYSSYLQRQGFPRFPNELLDLPSKANE